MSRENTVLNKQNHTFFKSKTALWLKSDKSTQKALCWAQIS